MIRVSSTGFGFVRSRTASRPGKVISDVLYRAEYTHRKLLICKWTVNHRVTNWLLLLTFFVIMEILEENQELILVPPQDGLNLRRLFRIGNKDLYSGSAPI